MRPISNAEMAKHDDVVQRAVGVAVRRCPRNVLREDLVAAGRRGLFLALQRATAEHGAVAFEGYLFACVYGAILDELRAEDWLSRRARRSGTIRFETSDDPPEIAVPPRDARSDAEMAIERLIAQLDPRDVAVLVGRYLTGRPMHTIAADLGVSQPRATQLLERALRRAAEILRDRET